MAGRFLQRTASFATCLLLVVAEGCQQAPTMVSGNVTLDGEPFTIAPDARGTVIFQPVGGQGTTLTGLLDPTGHFKLANGSSPDVAPGKYQVAVSVFQLLPKTEQAEQAAKRITPAKYAMANESGLDADVAPGENQFSFNLVTSADHESSSSPSPTPSSSGSSGSQPTKNSTGTN